MSAKELIESVASGESPRVVVDEVYKPATAAEAKKAILASVSKIEHEIEVLIDNGMVSLDEVPNSDKAMRRAEEGISKIEFGLTKLKHATNSIK